MQAPTEQAALPTSLPSQSSQGMPQHLLASEEQKLESRYELLYLIFQFLISLSVLVGIFLLIVVFQEAGTAVASGGVALATVVVSYWFGISRKRVL